MKNQVKKEVRQVWSDFLCAFYKRYIFLKV